MTWWTWMLVGLAALAVVATWWLLRVRPWRGPRTRHPVVLVHGILGFDEIHIGKQAQSYFRGIAEHLQRLGLRVHKVRLPPLGSVAARAQALRDALQAFGQRKLNLLAHSMGGLDARYAISRLGCHRHVLSLTTVGTPHRGTPVADLGAKLLARVGLPFEALRDMSTERMAAFNREVPNVRSVRYLSVVAVVSQGETKLHPLLVPSRAYLNNQAGPNDGLVPASSQAWGRVVARVEADHWAQIGWSSGFDAPAFYERLLTRMRAAGL